MSDVTTPEEIAASVPSWVPKETFSYLAHTEGGTSLRALARVAGVHASTVLRQVRSVEARREDVLVDRFLNRLGKRVHYILDAEDPDDLNRAFPQQEEDLTETELTTEASRVLGHLCDPASVMAVVAEMDKAVIVRETSGGDTTRRAVVGRNVAEAMALNGWIQCDVPGRILKYRITASGRTALGKFMAKAENKALGFAEAQASYDVSNASGQGLSARPNSRFQSAETPLGLLARRKDRDGKLFLGSELVHAGERLREDFVLAGFPTRKDETWDQFVCRTQADQVSKSPGSMRARERVVGALRDLGPGLGDAVLRCCCFLEGLEQTERRMGWSARSGKIVLRIALQRLKSHYAKLGEAGAMVG